MQPSEVWNADELEEVPETWAPSSLSDADWCLKRLGELEAEKAEVDAVLRDRVAELQTRAEKLKEKADRAISFISTRLRQYAEANREELLKGGKAKSRALLHGRIGWKKAGGAPVMTDAAQVLAWARAEAPQFVRTKEEPAWSDLKKHVAETGEVVPGVDMEPESEEFTWKAGGK